MDPITVLLPCKTQDRRLLLDAIHSVVRATSPNPATSRYSPSVSVS